MRKLICLMFLLFALPLNALAADEAAIPTAEELFQQYPVPEVTLTVSPAQDPYLWLVNKSNKITPWDYEPEDLRLPEVNSKNKNVLLRDEVATALEALFADALTQGHELTAVSGFRSYGTQKSIYRSAVEKKGTRQANLDNAKAGQSEHQTGMAMDISCPAIKNNLNKKFANTDEGKWVSEHCAEYGFIIRYKTEWVDVTKYKGEPWHLRYVGVEQAKFITKLNVPYEIYIAYLQMVWDAQNAGLQ